MALTFYPKPGMILVCDFKGYIAPEIIKTRPVVVISPAHLKRHDLITVVPLSTTAPNPVEDYHYLLKGSPVPGSARVAWAKCDLVATVCRGRLDRVRIARGNYQVGHISPQQVRAIRLAVACSLGIDITALKDDN